MKRFLFAVIVALFLANSCTREEPDVNIEDLLGYWQGESGDGFQFMKDGEYKFYTIESGIWIAASDTDNRYVLNGSEIVCFWVEDNYPYTYTYIIDSFSPNRMEWHIKDVRNSDDVLLKVNR